MTIPAGQVISGRYKVDRLIAEGGFGAVYLAYDNRLGDKKVALKEGFEKSPAAQEQFRFEAQLLANLQHASLPRVTDYFVEGDGRQFLVMDYIEGQDLDQYVIANGRGLPGRQAAALILQISEAVAYLHTRRPNPVIHRDIKPPNIKITREGRAVLVDFGIAKVYHPMKGTAKVAKAVTPHFSSPEQHIGKTDTRSDVYSLGATLYFAVCVEVPPDAMDRLNQGAVLKLPATLNTTVNPDLEKIIVKSLAMNPEDRFANANRLAAALRTFLSNRPLVFAVAPVAGQGITCPKCGWNNRPGARFCMKDGTPLTGRSAPQVQAGVSSPPQAAAAAAVQANNAPAQAIPGRVVPAQPVGGQVPAQPVGGQLPAELLFEMANAYARKRDYYQAIQRYEACLNMNFNDQAVYYNLAMAYLELGEPVKAGQALEKGIQVHPQDADLQYQLVQAYLAQQRTQDALAAIERACQLAPGNPLYLRQYGELLFNSGRAADAVRPLEACLQIDPNLYSAHFLLGRAQGELKNYKRAIDAMHSAAMLDSNQADPHIWSGIYYYQARKYKEAIPAFQDAIQRQPGMAVAYAWLGDSYVQLNQAQNGLPHYQHAVALEPGEAGYHTRLGRCYALLKRKSEAIKALRQALKLDPGDRTAQELLKKL